MQKKKKNVEITHHRIMEKKEQWNIYNVNKKEAKQHMRIGINLVSVDSVSSG